MPPYPSTIQGSSCPTFSPPPLKKFLDGSIQNLFDAIDWNKTHNGHHPLFEFTINKAEAAKLDESRTIEQPDSDQLLYQITWGDAYQAFENAARFASRQLKISPSLDSTPPVVAILAVAGKLLIAAMFRDAHSSPWLDPITYFIFIVGLIRAGYIPFPISPRNSAVAVAHLISKTNTRHIFVSGDPAMQKLAENSLALLRENTENEVVQVPKTLDCYRMPYFLELYGYQESLTSEPLPDLRGIRQDSPALIMHSSGTPSVIPSCTTADHAH
ncbi:hypothetical protein D9757_009276 [Collybiopsis confluens]|uniref:AMP-dependent synthetase/ligase domain-containing protein n=1 Tax=Collybiopsis confluens TaxID=2823264 RepID=A0A8H5HAA3_9AGAR|nr:hypothetical protein D9757_009276 [Collybiopsis confluens]